MKKRKHMSRVKTLMSKLSHFFQKKQSKFKFQMRYRIIFGGFFTKSESVINLEAITINSLQIDMQMQVGELFSATYDVLYSDKKSLEISRSQILFFNILNLILLSFTIHPSIKI